MKYLKIDDLAYQMLLALSKNKRKKPEECIEDAIKEQFKKIM